MAKLFVGNIPHSFSEINIAQWFESAGFGVESVEIVKDRSTGNPRGFGFITLKEGVRPSEAIQQLNGQRMAGRLVTVNDATPISHRDNVAQFRRDRQAG